MLEEIVVFKVTVAEESSKVTFSTIRPKDIVATLNDGHCFRSVHQGYCCSNVHQDQGRNNVTKLATEMDGPMTCFLHALKRKELLKRSCCGFMTPIGRHKNVHLRKTKEIY